MTGRGASNPGAICYTSGLAFPAIFMVCYGGVRRLTIDIRGTHPHYQQSHYHQDCIPIALLFFPLLVA